MAFNTNKTRQIILILENGYQFIVLKTYHNLHIASSIPDNAFLNFLELMRESEHIVIRKDRNFPVICDLYR